MINESMVICSLKNESFYANVEHANLLIVELLPAAAAATVETAAVPLAPFVSR